MANLIKEMRRTASNLRDPHVAPRMDVEHVALLLEEGADVLAQVSALHHMLMQVFADSIKTQAGS